MHERLIYVLYGSQTGNAESIAKEMSEKLSAENIKNKCLALNMVKGQPLKEIASGLIVVCSTTGNGDCPENANDWWRTVKLRSAAKDTFEGVSFTVLGLGDTNYDKFCYMGKSIDKRLFELGGKRLIPVTCADEGTGLEETIEAWKKSTLVLARKVHAESVTKANSKCVTEPDDEEKIGEDMRRLEVDIPSTVTPTSTSPVPPTPCDLPAARHQMPANILSVEHVASLLGLTDKLATAPTAAQLPRAKACPEEKCPYRVADGSSTTLSIAPVMVPCTESCANLNTKARSGSDHSLSDGAIWTVDNPFPASVASAKWLTTKPPKSSETNEWGSCRRVIYLELDIAGSGIQYSPGDSIGLCCPNAPYAVSIVMQRLQAAHPETTLTPDTVISCTVDASRTTLQELLEFKYDLMGAPKKATMLTLAQCCTDPAESNLLQHLCSKSECGKALWSKCIESQRVGFAEVLTMFPSCLPRLHQLVACLTPLPPRYYSIATSPLANNNRLAIAFSVVRYTCQADLTDKQIEPIRRGGLCTTYLEQELYPILCQRRSIDDSTITPRLNLKVRMFHKVSAHFHLPGSVAPPLILVGPGTGVAPFMGFLEHRAQLAMERRRSAGSEGCCMGMWRGGFEMEQEDLPTECSSNVEAFIHAVEPGPVHLFFGCRNDHDYLFKEELQEHLCCRTLTELDVAMSRVDTEKVYVTHKLLERAGEIARMILDDGAHIYICGDGNRMAKDVYATFKTILSSYAGISDEQAEALFQDMKLRRRYILDIWS